jgi:hypothetical protein
MEQCAEERDCVGRPTAIARAEEFEEQAIDHGAAQRGQGRAPS